MRKERRLFLWLWIFILLTGCVGNPEPIRREVDHSEIQTGSTDTGCCGVLARIWQSYAPAEQFAVFGGDAGSIVSGEPGDLEIGSTVSLQQRFFLPLVLTECITEGAALEHLLNRNVFCAGVFRVKDGTDPITFAGQMQDNLDGIPWEEGSPRRFLIAQPEENIILLAYGQTSVIETFLIRMNQTYPGGRILAYQELLRKNTAAETAFGSTAAVFLSNRKVLDPVTAFDHTVAEETF